MPLPEDIAGSLPPGGSVVMQTPSRSLQANFAAPRPSDTGSQFRQSTPTTQSLMYNSIWGGQNVERTRFIPMVED